MQLPHPARSSFTTLPPPMASSNPWTYLSLKASSEWEIPTPLPRQTNPSSKLPPAPFVLLHTKRQREEELTALSPKAPSTLLTSCSSSPLQIWRFFSFAAIPTLSWGPQKQGQTAAAFCRKGHLLIACQLRDNVHPPEEGRYHLLCVTFAQCFGTQLCKCTAIRAIVQILQTHPKPWGQYQLMTFKYLGLCT